MEGLWSLKLVGNSIAQEKKKKNNWRGTNRSGKLNLVNRRRRRERREENKFVEDQI